MKRLRRGVADLRIAAVCLAIDLLDAAWYTRPRLGRAARHVLKLAACYAIVAAFWVLLVFTTFAGGAP